MRGSPGTRVSGVRRNTAASANHFKSKESAFLEGGFDLPLEGAIPKTTSSATTIEPHVPDLVYLDGAHIV